MYKLETDCERQKIMWWISEQFCHSGLFEDKKLKCRKWNCDQLILPGNGMANSTRHQWGRKSRNTNPRTQQVNFYKIRMQIQIEIQIPAYNRSFFYKTHVSLVNSIQKGQIGFPLKCMFTFTKNLGVIIHLKNKTI